MTVYWITLRKNNRAVEVFNVSEQVFNGTLEFIRYWHDEEKDFPKKP